MQSQTSASEPTLRSIIASINKRASEIELIADEIDDEINGPHPEPECNVAPHPSGLRHDLYRIEAQLSEAFSTLSRLQTGIGQRITETACQSAGDERTNAVPLAKARR